MHAPTINTITLYSEIIKPNTVPVALVFSNISILSRETLRLSINATFGTRTKKSRETENVIKHQTLSTRLKKYLIILESYCIIVGEKPGGVSVC